MDQLQKDILNSVVLSHPNDGKLIKRYADRVKAGLLTRDENSQSHFCVYFLPYNPKTKEVFLVHHKKSGLWLSAGGHIDKGETIKQALNREIKEELGVSDFFRGSPSAFLITITPIERVASVCKEHFDIWFLMETDGSKFNVDPKEFYATKWLSIPEARKIVTDTSNLQALDIIDRMNV